MTALVTIPSPENHSGITGNRIEIDRTTRITLHSTANGLSFSSGISFGESKTNRAIKQFCLRGKNQLKNQLLPDDSHALKTGEVVWRSGANESGIISIQARTANSIILTICDGRSCISAIIQDGHENTMDLPRLPVISTTHQRYLYFLYLAQSVRDDASNETDFLGMSPAEALMKKAELLLGPEYAHNGFAFAQYIEQVHQI